MGEIAEAMQDGILCETCGDYLGDAVGYPRKCKHCRKWEKAANEDGKGQLNKKRGKK